MGRIDLLIEAQTKPRANASLRLASMERGKAAAAWEWWRVGGEAAEGSCWRRCRHRVGWPPPPSTTAPSSRCRGSSSGAASPPRSARPAGSRRWSSPPEGPAPSPPTGSCSPPTRTRFASSSSSRLSLLRSHQAPGPRRVRLIGRPPVRHGSPHQGMDRDTDFFFS